MLLSFELPNTSSTGVSLNPTLSYNFLLVGVSVPGLCFPRGKDHVSFTPVFPVLSTETGEEPIHNTSLLGEQRTDDGGRGEWDYVPYSSLRLYEIVTTALRVQRRKSVPHGGGILAVHTDHVAGQICCPELVISWPGRVTIRPMFPASAQAFTDYTLAFPFDLHNSLKITPTR